MTQEPTEKSPSDHSWNNLSEKIGKAVLDYNTKHKAKYPGVCNK